MFQKFHNGYLYLNLDAKHDAVNAGFALLRKLKSVNQQTPPQNKVYRVGSMFQEPLIANYARMQLSTFYTYQPDPADDPVFQVCHFNLHYNQSVHIYLLTTAV